MKVALVLEQFIPHRGGLEQWTARFAAQLAQRGHEVHVVAGRFDPRTAAMPIVAHCLDSAGTRLAFAEAAQAKLLALAPEVIHDMGSGWYCDVFHPHGGSWASVTERKLLLKPAWLRPWKRRIDRLLRRQREFHILMAHQYADNGQLLVALSRTVADDFEHFHRVPRSRIRVVYNGVDPEQFSPSHRGAYRQTVREELGIDDTTVLALIVGHNFRLKGVPTLLRAMRRLMARGVPIHLAVVGGKHLSGWRRAARRLGIAGAVSFLGPKEDTVPYYAAADAYVHPTFYDTCSLVVLEAAASGLPIVTTRLNGASELLSEGREGFLLPDPADDEALADRMERLMDARLRETMGSAARQTALRHTLARNVEEMLAVYEESLALRRSTRRMAPIRAESLWAVPRSSRVA